MPSSDEDHEPVPHQAAPPRLFGRWLVDNAVIDEAALAEALELMSLVNRTVGEFATAKGLLTEAQAEHVNALQLEIDAQWGSIALASGIGSLTPLSLEQLLAEQAANNLRLSDALVELEHLDLEQVDRLWARYSEECGAVDPFATLPESYRKRLAVREVLRIFPRLAVRLLALPMRLGAPRPWSGGVTDAVTCAVELHGLHLGLIVHAPTKLEPTNLGALLQAVVWHATRRFRQGSAANSALVREPDHTGLPATGVAIDAALGDDSCTIVIAPEESDPSESWQH